MRAALTTMMAALLTLSSGLAAERAAPPGEGPKRPEAPKAGEPVARTPEARLRELTEELPVEMEGLVAPGEAGSLQRPVDAEIRLASNALAEIAKGEREWKEAWERLDRAVRAQAEQFSLFTEAETAAAMEAYAVKLKASGEALLKAYAELTRENIELKGNLKRGPTYLREVAALYERYAAEEEYEDIKKQYYDLRDIWLARAKLLEQRAGSIEAFYDPHLVPYLRGWNRFLERLIPTLDFHYPFDRANQEEYSRFARQLDEHMKRVRGLTDAIGKWRAAALKQAEDPGIQEEEKERADSLGAMLSPMAIPFARTTRAKEVVFKGGLSKGQLYPGDVVLIVRPEPARMALDYIARARVALPGGPLELLDDAPFEPGDLALLPWAELPQQITVAPPLRAALSAVKTHHDRTVADIEAQRAQVLAHQEDARRDVLGRLAPVWTGQMFHLWPNYRQGANPPRDVAQVFCNPRWKNPFFVGTHVTLYRDSDITTSGTAVITAIGPDYMLLRSSDGRPFDFEEDVMFTPYGEQTLLAALRAVPRDQIIAMRPARRIAPAEIAAEGGRMPPTGRNSATPTRRLSSGELLARSDASLARARGLLRDTAYRPR